MAKRRIEILRHAYLSQPVHPKKARFTTVQSGANDLGEESAIAVTIGGKTFSPRQLREIADWLDKLGID